MIIGWLKIKEPFVPFLEVRFILWDSFYFELQLHFPLLILSWVEGTTGPGE